MAQRVTKHPIGFNARRDFDAALLRARALEVGGLRATLVQVDADELWKLVALRGAVDVMIWRTHGDDALHRTHPDAEAWVDARLAEADAAGFERGEWWLHLHNEAGVTAEVAAWEARAIRHGVARGGRFIALNPSAGTPEEGAIALARPVLDLAQRHPDQVMVGVHEYYYVLHNAYNEGLVHHVGRVKQWLAYCRANGLDKVRFCVTECGPDSLPDVKDRDPGRWPHTVAPDGRTFGELRGYRTLAEAYKREWPADFAALGLGGLTMRELARCWEKVWRDSVAFALYFCLGEAYSSGWHGPHPWRQFNVERDESFWQQWRVWEWDVHTVDVNPSVADSRWVAAEVRPRSATGSVNVRVSPSTSSAVVGSIQAAGVRAHVIPFDALTAVERARAGHGDRRWHLIKLPNNTVGWYADWVTVTTPTVSAPPPPTAPEPEPDGGAARPITRAELDRVAAALEADLESRLLATLAHELRRREQALLTALAQALTRLLDERGGGASAFPAVANPDRDQVTAPEPRVTVALDAAQGERDDVVGTPAAPTSAICPSIDRAGDTLVPRVATEERGARPPAATAPHKQHGASDALDAAGAPLPHQRE